jgi:hypothetical protein
MGLEELLRLSLFVFHVVVRDGGCESDGFGFEVLILHFFAKFFEETLQELFLVVHDLDNWRRDLLVSKDQVFFSSISCLLSFSESHLTKESIIFIKASNHFIFAHLDLFIMWIVPRSDQITKCSGIDFSVTEFTGSSLTHRIS